MSLKSHLISNIKFFFYVKGSTGLTKRSKKVKTLTSCKASNVKPNDSLPSNMDRNISLTLNCMQIIARSLNTRISDNLLNILFIVENIDVCCITEIWSKSGDRAVLANSKYRGYEITSSHRA